MKHRNFVVAAAGAFLLALSAHAQITAIEGDVKGPDGNPAVKATVKIVRTDIKGNYKCDTNKKGHYFYNGLPLGTYDITVEIDGKTMDMVKGVRTRLGDPTPVNFDLQKVAQANSARQAAAASGNGQALTKEQERGMTKEQKDQYEKALKDREAAMKKNKELNDAFNAGMTAMQAKDYDTAVASLTKASELDPKQVAVWANLADAYIGQASKKTGADFDATMAKGLEAYQKAIELNPTDGATHNNYALALAKAKKFDDMQKELQKAAELDPGKAGQYYYNLGAILTNSGQSDAAIAAFQKAIQADPNHAESYYQLGVSLTSKMTMNGDKPVPAPGTVEALQKYLQLAPNGPNAQAAKDLLTTFSSSVDTSYKNPNAPTTTKKKK
ncbi:MAG TPA: tetratricopeptide repeat protein [Candidatus Acidoferrales bacterium]|nr:tetratricopeptide repeat protein [Candidatus Acidoferrales bacterium]